ncbi:DUF699-domain-containing protein [Gonapodya prolifera JEL478]|uniref:RNA cytidine acetyltransferase n=1 Tax=Gonapodya prolifera (strain JEL478) TaxID=1344416 RepID=A0A138ZZW4_GONPJ|nr:DUF699-domain-containing protein [Gonapodya prolifera JEL478]|eukprot:KXS10044.1 DUF699-domain-containing protein [Gonapodya prolifera JEL478]
MAPREPEPAASRDEGGPSGAHTPRRKKLDSRIVGSINSAVAGNHRNLFIIVGDHARDQVPNLHFILSKARVASRPSVLWCYKKELGFSSHRKKRMKIIKKQIQRGTRDADEDDPFELFVASTEIRYCYYKETDKILGQTFGMCVLQDFESLTPNLLARTVETVSGGGLVILMLNSLSSLKKLYALSMDAHARYRTEARQDVVGRFNERFLLSLADCQGCLVVDDELNVLNVTSARDLTSSATLPNPADTKDDPELVSLKESLKDVRPVGPIVGLAKTLDQGKAVLTFVDSIAEKSLGGVVALTAARGRGKSAAMGMALAAAVSYGYANIFLTSPSPTNLPTLFRHLLLSLDALEYQEHLDYTIHQSTDPASKGVVVRLDIHRGHRQTVQYIHPQDAHLLAQAELVVVDEAAGIPVNLVRSMVGDWVTWMSSTVNGYEGTGRSLSLKLVKELREASSGGNSSSTLKSSQSAPSATLSKRSLREITLSTPIRYASSDPVESWLNKLLCLDCCDPYATGAASVSPQPSPRPLSYPDPSACDLYIVSRDSLFSYHPAAEQFLRKMVAVYVAGHYKNSPNDLMLMGDAPGHVVAVLTAPQVGSGVPEPIVVVQMCLEGSISRATVLRSLSRGHRPDGDLVPWVVSQQFGDDGFAQLSGARIVRIATSSEYVGMGYGGRCMEEVVRWIESGEDGDEGSSFVEEGNVRKIDDTAFENDSRHLLLKPRDAAKLPALLRKAKENPPRARLDWIAVSYGLTTELHRFWKRHGFRPVYLRQTANDVTGEHTCIVIREMLYDDREGQGWIEGFTRDFAGRFVELLSYPNFRHFTAVTCLSILEAAIPKHDPELLVAKRTTITPIQRRMDLYRSFSPHDLARLEQYGNNMADHHVIVDLVPKIATLYFLGGFSYHVPGAQGDDGDGGVRLSPVQSSVLCGMGLQRKAVEEIESEIKLPVSQILALFTKVVRKVVVWCRALEKSEVAMEIDEERKFKNNTAAKAEHLSVSETNPDGIDEGSATSSGSDDEDQSDREDGVQSQVKVGKKRPLPTDEDGEEAWDPTPGELDDELEEAGKEAVQQWKEKQREMISSMDLGKYAIATADGDKFEVPVNFNPSTSKSGIVSLPSKTSNKERTAKHSGQAAALAEKHRGEKGAQTLNQVQILRKLKGKLERGSKGGKLGKR